MMHDFSFHFNNIKMDNRHPCTLEFEGTCTGARNNVIVTYTGAGIECKTNSIHEDTLNKLKNMLNDDYDYGPFDIKTAKKTLSSKDSYYIDFD